MAVIIVIVVAAAGTTSSTSNSSSSVVSVVVVVLVVVLVVVVLVVVVLVVVVGLRYFVRVGSVLLADGALCGCEQSPTNVLSLVHRPSSLALSPYTATLLAFLFNRNRSSPPRPSYFSVAR